MPAAESSTWMLSSRTLLKQENGRMLSRSTLSIEQVLIEHINILTALKEGNGKQAGKEMSQHLENTEKVLLDMIKQREAPEQSVSGV